MINAPLEWTIRLTQLKLKITERLKSMVKIMFECKRNIRENDY